MRLAGFTKSIFHLSCCDRIYFLAVMAGGASGTLIFQWLDTGLAAPVSPGSLLVILPMRLIHN
ncbi:PTS system, mannitol-specific IICB component [Enterococcus faecium]|nr:PTS system, mannitol-specific IICB component [Enterococcus faecium]